MQGPVLRKRTFVVVCWLAVVAWMAVIFMFSATAADDSNEQSGVFCHAVASLLVPDYAQMDDAGKEAAASQYQHVVRKCGHASEYALLGMLCALACWASLGQKAEAARRGLAAPETSPARGPSGANRHSPEHRRRTRILQTGALAWLICVLYAMGDEVHQLFVPGRSCQLGDVAIDATGAVAGVVLVLLLVLAAGRRHTADSRSQ